MTEECAALASSLTPLGNLADLTRRAEEILRSVPWVAAGDTWHSGPLLKQLGALGPHPAGAPAQRERSRRPHC